MKSTETKVLENKKEKENKGKKTIMSTSENAKNNSYEEFRIEKLDYLFKLSEEDIETKIKKMIALKKKGGNLDEYNQNELNKIQFKKQSFSPLELKSENNKQQRMSEKLTKIKMGLNKFINFVSLTKRNKKISSFKELKSYYNKLKSKKEEKE